ncbi:MAG: tetratricopeptide repeat protein [Deltaproteobacteria bacterium]|nr:tetratricopeptide repeat protein [Deltaproteobacteria bacterium]
MVRIGNKHFAAIALFLLVFVWSCGSNPKQRNIAEAHLTMGIAHLAEGQESQALRSFLEAEQLYPHNERIHYFKGVIYANRGLFPEAKESLAEAIRINPRYSQALTFIGSLYIQEKNYDQAIVYLKKALENPLYDSPAAALYNLATAYWRQGDKTKAIATAQKAVVVDPGSPLFPNVYLLLGDIYKDAGDYEKAQTHYEKTLALDSTNSAALAKLAEIKQARQ